MITPSTARLINVLGAIGIGLILTGAYIFQFVLQELPCPLCLLQRIGFLCSAFGLLLNVKYGLRPEHYGITIFGAFFGGIVSMRQILLHIVPVPGEPTGYGSPLLGMHIYTWGLLIQAVTVIAVAILLILCHDFGPRAEQSLTGIYKLAFLFFMVLASFNVITTFLECGLLPCPDDPVEYIMLK